MAWLCAESPVSANVVLVSLSSSIRNRVALSGSRSRVPGSRCPPSLGTPRGLRLAPSPLSALSGPSSLLLLRTERGAITTDVRGPWARSRDKAWSPGATANRGRPRRDRGVAGALPGGPRWKKTPGFGAQRGAELGCCWGQQAPRPQAPGAQRTKSPAPARSALSRAGEPQAVPTFPIAARSERSGKRGSRSAGGRRWALRWPAAEGAEALRTPTPCKLSRGSGLRGAGGCRSPGLGFFARAGVRTVRTAATRGWSPNGSAGGAGAGARAGGRRCRGAPGTESRAPELLCAPADGCGHWKSRRPSLPLGLAELRRTLAVRGAPRCAAGLGAEPVRPSRGGRPARSCWRVVGHWVGDFLLLPDCSFLPAPGG